MNWQPIETAPKDGTLFLGYYRSHGGGRGYVKETWWGPVSGARKMFMLRGHQIDPINTLTHWTPLLEPPNDQ
jgi:hypothetical protein